MLPDPEVVPLVPVVPEPAVEPLVPVVLLVPVLLVPG